MPPPKVVAKENPDVFEEKEVPLKIRLKSGDLGGKSAKVVFHRGGLTDEVIVEKTVTIDVSVVSCAFTPPKVKDEEASYKVTYAVIVEGDPQPHDYFPFMTVWPINIAVVATHADGPKAGQPFENATFSFTAGGQGAQRRNTNDRGEAVYRLLAPGSVDVSWSSPLDVTEWTQATGRRRTCKVKRHPYKAQLRWPAAGSHKQWVNVAAKDGEPSLGSKLKLFLEAEGDQARGEDAKHGEAGKEIHVRVTFGQNNSARNDTPKPQVVGVGDGGAAVVRTFVRPLGAKGAPAVVELELGVAGGDTCNVKVGITPACADHEVTFTNWRKVYYESVHPKPADPEKVTDTKLKPTAAGMSTAMTDVMTAALGVDKAFIELAPKREAYYDKTALPGAWTIFDAAYLKGTAGNKVVVLQDGQLDAIRANDGDTVGGADTISVYWTDYLADDDAER